MEKLILFKMQDLSGHTFGEKTPPPTIVLIQGVDFSTLLKQIGIKTMQTANSG